MSKLTQLEDRGGFVLFFVLGIKICFKLWAVLGPDVIYMPFYTLILVPWYLTVYSRIIHSFRQSFLPLAFS